MALNKAQTAALDEVAQDLMVASSWISGNRSTKLAQLAKRVAEIAGLEDPAPDVPAPPSS